MDQLISLLGNHGPMGLVAAVALWWAWKKDRQVSALTRRLIEKSEKDGDKYHQFALEATNTMKALTSAVLDKED